MTQQRAWLTGVAWALAIAVLGMVAIALLTSRYGWLIYLELLSHFQLQYFGLSVLCVGVIALMRRRRPLLLALGGTVILGVAQVLPWYLPPHFLTGNGQGNLRVLIANVNTQNQQYGAVLTWAQQAKPDLALFIEVDDRWVNELDALRSQLPYTSGEANPFNTGIVLYSRYPLSATQVKRFREENTPSILSTVTINGQPLTVVGTHPVPPIRPEIFHARNRQLADVSQYLQTVAAPKILMGDLNITMWSPYYHRLVNETGLKNVRQGFGVRPSWPTPGSYGFTPRWVMRPLAIPIDHCLVSPEVVVTNVQVGPYLGSDHRPVIVDLRV